MEEKKERIKSPYIKAMLAGFGALALAVTLGFILYFFPDIAKAFAAAARILRPFIIGGAIAYILCPLCNKSEKWLSQVLPEKIKKWAPGLAVTVSIVFFLLLIYLLLMMIIPQLYASIISLSKTLPDEFDALMKRISRLLSDNPTLSGYVTTLYENARKSIESWMNNKLLPDMSGIINGVGNGVMSVLSGFLDAVIGTIVAVYCLHERKVFSRQVKMTLYSIAGEKWGNVIREEAGYADRMFNNFLSGKFVESAIIGVICYFYCLITKMPNTLLVSVVIGITNIIPFFGPFIGAIPMVLLILVDSPMKALWFAIFILVLQQVDGNIIGPKILGDSTGLSSFWILFSIMVFGGMFGFIGMIIGVPLFAVIYDVIRKLIKRGLARKRIEKGLYETEPEEISE